MAEEIFSKLKKEKYLSGLTEVDFVKHGYIIRFDRVSTEEMIRASQESFLRDYGSMEKLFAKCLYKM